VFALICRDVTERELGDAAFPRDSKDIPRSSLKNISDIVTLLDLDGRIVFQSLNSYNQSLLPQSVRTRNLSAS
jgi:hypothetical protein